MAGAVRICRICDKSPLAPRAKDLKYSVEPCCPGVCRVPSRQFLGMKNAPLEQFDMTKTKKMWLVRAIAWPIGASGTIGLGRLWLEGALSAPDGIALIFAAMCCVPLAAMAAHAVMSGPGLRRARRDDPPAAALPEAY